MEKLLSFIILLLCCFIDKVIGHHYRGVTVSSEWLSNGDEIHFASQFYYRRNNSGNGAYVHCDDLMIQDKTLTKDPNSIVLTMYKRNNQNVAYLQSLSNSFICKSHSPNQDWSIVAKSETINISEYNISENEWIYFYLDSNGGQWSFVNIGYIWNHFSHKIKNKNNNWNTPPTTKAFPIYEILSGCKSQLELPIEDIDNDIIRCRPSSTNGLFGKECVACNLESVELNSETCTLYFPPSLKRDIIIELQIEDFKNENDTLPMSSVPLQFIVTFKNNIGTISCEDLPQFTPVVPPSKSCVAISNNSIYTGIIEAKSKSSNISDIMVYQFSGYTKSDLTYNATSRSWYYNYTIKVDYSNIQQESVLLYATSASGLSSPYHTIKYLLNYEPPKITNVRPIDEICSTTKSEYEWTFFTNRDVVLPKKSSFIRFMKTSVNTSIPTTVFEFDMSTNNNRPNNYSVRIFVKSSLFNVNETYSILFDFGVITTDDYCRPQSEAMLDLNKYKFKIIKDS
ncbi:unnamed protein product, partial [Didymodactylos carnosus]